ncbi:MAG: glycosyltransferase family 2 protein [Pseudomonadota bacterium]|nr:glycosyltransferase family 2 protein [Pseudomonadota bacterium]
MGAEDLPRVSIGLPVFNGEKYITETLDSILAQTFRDFELIICDNASTDRTEAICRSYAQTDPRVRYHRQPTNLGACANYDMAFRMSRAPYFKWHAHDDLLAPKYLERMVGVLDGDPTCILAHSQTVRINGFGTQTLCFLDQIDFDSDEPARRLAHWVLPLARNNAPIFGLIRRDAMERTPLHGDFIASDRVFLAAITLLGRSRIVPEPLFFNRDHPQTSTRGQTTQKDRLSWNRGRPSRWPILRDWRILKGFLDALGRVSLTRRERLAAYWVLLNWCWLYRSDLALELMLPLFWNGRPTRLGRLVIDGKWNRRIVRRTDVTRALRRF